MAHSQSVRAQERNLSVSEDLVRDLENNRFITGDKTHSEEAKRSNMRQQEAFKEYLEDGTEKKRREENFLDVHVEEERKEKSK